MKGLRVLAVDLDSQGNLTTLMAPEGMEDYGRTIREALVEKKDLPYLRVADNLYLTPATLSLSNIENEMVTFFSREQIFKKLLDEVSDEFDIIIIDCPPSLGLLTVNALSAADGIVIPMQCEYYSLEGLSQLMMTVRRVKNQFNPSLGIMGILITMYDGRLNLSAQVLAELKKYYADKLFRTMIPRNVKLSEAPSFGAPVYYHDKYSRGSLAYIDVAKELLDRIF